MTEATLPEIQHLRKLIEALPSRGGDSAASVIVPLYSEITGAEGDYATVALMYRTLDQLPEIIAEKFPEKGRRAAAIGVINQLKEYLSPLKLARPYPEYFANYGPSLKRQLEVFSVLEDLEFDVETLGASADSIVSEIEKMRQKVGQAEDISDASKSFLNGQLVLLERAVLRFNTTGVGPFRDSVFCSFGKIFIELKSQDNTVSSTVELLDDFLRLYGLFQAGGDILRLTGPVIAGLLNAPAS